jgi:hypothetical protein
VVAGTVFTLPDPGAPPFAGVTVTLYDATPSPTSTDAGVPSGSTTSTMTNTEGNFFIRKGDWSPVFPIHSASLTYPGTTFSPEMHTHIGRDGSCASCHFDPRGPNARGHIYFATDPTDLPRDAPGAQ